MAWRNLIYNLLFLYEEVKKKCVCYKKSKNISSRSIPSLVRLYDDIKNIVKIRNISFVSNA